MRRGKGPVGADLIAVAFGGALGAGLRWQAGRLGSGPSQSGWFSYSEGTTPIGAALQFPSHGFPAGTLAVNLLGTLILGVVVAWRVASPHRRRLWLGLATGFCGSLTTFSTFATDVAIRLGGWGVEIRSGGGASRRQVLASRVNPLELGDVAIYVITSLVGGALAFWVGSTVGRRFAPRSDEGPPVIGVRLIGFVPLREAGGSEAVRFAAIAWSPVVGFAMFAAAGAVVRHIVTVGERAARIPWRTFGVNVAGALLLGLFIGWNWDQPSVVVTVAGLGSLTTFSTVVAEVAGLAHDGRRRHAMLYVGATLVVGIAAAHLGLVIGART